MALTVLGVCSVNARVMPTWRFASALVQAAGGMAIEGDESLAPALLNLVDRVIPDADRLGGWVGK